MGRALRDILSTRYYHDMHAPPKRAQMFAVTDLGELAARLGSIVTFDRRGMVVWLDDFEDNIDKWLQQPQGVGAGVSLSTVAARNGAQSARLTTGNVVNDTTWIGRSLPYPVLTRVGFEYSFVPQSAAAYYFIQISLDDGTTLYTAEARHYPPGEVRIQTTGGAWETIASDQVLGAGMYSFFHTWKLVVDRGTAMYVRLIVNNTEYDLSAYDMYDYGITVFPYFSVSAGIVAGAALNMDFFIDDAIITQDEP